MAAQPPSVLPVMVGTAGHVDHGKTSLVRALTGFDTDTLKEEKQRGMSIDFGVAPFMLPGGQMVGLIDVPGHEDFIRNMIAGAASIDLLLLVIAADDAVMPQTREHLRIVTLLGLSTLVVAVTKMDLVDPELARLVIDDVSAFLAEAGFAGAPVIPVSNVTKEGISELQAALAARAEEIVRRPDERSFRMYVRRSFTLKGHGTVVTGIPTSGSCGSGETLELLPGGEQLVLRGVQSYRRPAARAVAHVSCALNVRDAEPGALERGRCLCAPHVYRQTREALVRIVNDSPDQVLKSRRMLRVLFGTAAATARLQLLDAVELGPGSTGFARLRFNDPVVLTAGDRFVLRLLSPGATVGGGRVLSSRPGRIKRTQPGFKERLLTADALIDREDHTGAELAAGAAVIVSPPELAHAAARPAAEATLEAERLAQDGLLQPLAAGHWVVAARLPEVARMLKAALRRYHRQHELSLGMKPSYAGELTGAPPAVFESLLPLLLSVDEELVTRHGHLALRSFTPKIGARELKLHQQALGLIHRAGAESIAPGTLKEQLSLSDAELKVVIKLLIDAREAVHAGHNLLPFELVERWRLLLLELFERMPLIELKDFRELTGASRNVAVSVLELFDREGLTKRQGSGRVLARRKMGPKAGGAASS